MAGVRLRPVFELPHLPHILLVHGERKTLGRSKDSDIVIDEGSLSRIHAVVCVSPDGAITVEDQESTNGVFVNGERVRQAAIQLADRVRFGAVEYHVESEAPATPAAPVAADGQTIVRMPIASAPQGVDRAGIEALLATSRELMAFAELQVLLDSVLDRLQVMLRPARSAILLVDREGQLEPRAVRPAGAYKSISEFASATLVREALARREVIVVCDTHADARLRDAASIVSAGVRSAICVPLLGRSGPVGVLYADQVGLKPSFAPEQVEYAAAFAAHAAVAIETAGLYEERERHYQATLEALAKTIDARDRYTAGHSDRVTAYTIVLADRVGLGAEEIEVIRRAGLLHDIGKVGVPDRVLLKTGPLTSDERATMETHVTIGHTMLKSVPFLRECLPAIRGHHERWDGAGYPDKLAGLAIPLHARLMAVADSFDAMTSARPYREALSVEEATRRLRADSGTQFDPDAVLAFIASEDQIHAIYRAAQVL